MSFERSSSSRLESQPTTTRRSDDPEYADDPEFQQYTRDISEKLFSQTTNINQLSKQVAILGTRQETERVRERVQTLIEETNAAFKDIGERLKRVSAWPDLGHQQKYTQGKLNNEFTTSITEFQVQQQMALSKQRAARAALDDSQSQHQQGTSQPDLLSDQQQQQEQQRLANQAEVDFQQALIIERDSEIRNVEQSVSELNDLFRDVATIVQEQGESLNTISDNVHNTRTDVQSADRELRSASRYQRSARSKACCLLLVLAIILVVIILAVVLG